MPALNQFHHRTNTKFELELINLVTGYSDFDIRYSIFEDRRLVIAPHDNEDDGGK